MSREPGPPADDSERLLRLVEERTLDLQRVKAEYDNYRKRVLRDRLAVREIAVSNVLARLLAVLDTVDRAREVQDPAGGFDLVARELEETLGALGLRSFGRRGDPFDPTCHEALATVRDDTLDGPTCAVVHRTGYRVGDQLLRAAEVTVAAPGPVRD
ncbi:MAG: nucleotide exchange factor GrpE [Streptomycetaceae bacterium]|nr:nucleotide exchange factor GrpE [Streptomycetaceae bacterium]